jgi:hypothetical protein
MRFAKGNQAAANPSKKAVAALIKKRLETDGANMSSKEFTELTSQYATLTKPRQRRRSRKKNKTKKASGIDALTREVMRIEAEELEARQKKWREEYDAKQKEPAPTPPASSLPEYSHKIWTNVLDD